MMMVKNKNDKGFSLIELIVVIAIMMVLSVVAILGLSSLTNQKAKKATALIQATLNNTQTRALTKRKGTCRITTDTDGNYVIYDEDGKSTKLADSSIQISYQLDNNNADYEAQKISSSNELKLTFDSSSGAFLPVVLDDGSGNPKYATGIRVRRGDYVQTIVLCPKTGRNYLQE